MKKTLLLILAVATLVLALPNGREVSASENDLPEAYVPVHISQG